jgi:hypothetical protein
MVRILLRVRVIPIPVNGYLKDQLTPILATQDNEYFSARPSTLPLQRYFSHWYNVPYIAK